MLSAGDKDSLLCGDTVEGDIPVLGVKVVDLLAAMGQPEQVGLMAVVVVFKGKGAVIKAAAHAHAITLLIKCHKWHQYQIKISGADFIARVGGWLWYAEAIGVQRGILLVAYKPQSVLRARF